MMPAEPLRIPFRTTVALSGCLLLALLINLLIYRVEGGWFSQLGALRNLAAVLLSTLPLAAAAYLGEGVSRLSRQHLLLLWGGMVALRLCIPWGVLEGSDDAFRYLWDGRVLDSGVNPFLHAPQAEPLRHLRESVFYPHIYRPDMRTVYPPLAQFWFWVAYRLSPDSFWGLKLILLIHDLATVALLLLLLRGRGLPPLRSLIYAWSPLALTQLFAAGHLDGVLIPWCLLSLLLSRRHPLAAGGALAASAMVRPLTCLCAPALTLRRPWQESLWAVLGFFSVAALLLSPFAAAGQGIFESLLVYAEHWRFNGSLFLAAEAMWGKEPWVRQALYIATAAVSLGAAALPLRLASRYMVALGSYFALAPTVYPWYLLGLAAIAILHSSTLALLLPALVSLSDLVLVSKAFGGPWQVPEMAYWVEYGLLYGLLLCWGARYVIIKRRRATDRVSSGPRQCEGR